MRFQPCWPDIDVCRSHVTLALPLSYHGYGDPHGEEEGEVLSVGDAALPHRQALAGGEARLRHHRLRRGGELPPRSGLSRTVARIADVLTCPLSVCRLTWTTCTAWWPFWRRSESL